MTTKLRRFRVRGKQWLLLLANGCLSTRLWLEVNIFFEKRTIALTTSPSSLLWLVVALSYCSAEGTWKTTVYPAHTANGAVPDPTSFWCGSGLPGYVTYNGVEISDGPHRGDFLVLPVVKCCYAVSDVCVSYFESYSRECPTTVDPYRQIEVFYHFMQYMVMSGISDRNGEWYLGFCPPSGECTLQWNPRKETHHNATLMG